MISNILKFKLKRFFTVKTAQDKERIIKSLGLVSVFVSIASYKYYSVTSGPNAFRTSEKEVEKLLLESGLQLKPKTWSN